MHCNNIYWLGLWLDSVIEQVLMQPIKTRGGLTRGRGIKYSVQIIYVNSMHQYSMIHQAMHSLTQIWYDGGKTQVEVTTSRQIRGKKDLATLTTWFRQRNPLDPANWSFRSLSTGLAAASESKYNCDSAEAIGSNIQKAVDGVTLEGAIVKRKCQIRTLETLQTSISI